MFTVLPKIFALAPTNHRFTEKNWLGGDIGCEDSVQDNNLPLWGLGALPPAAGQFLRFFRKK